MQAEKSRGERELSAGALFVRGALSTSAGERKSSVLFPAKFCHG